MYSMDLWSQIPTRRISNFVLSLAQLFHNFQCAILVVTDANVFMCLKMYPVHIYNSYPDSIPKIAFKQRDK